VFPFLVKQGSLPLTYFSMHSKGKGITCLAEGIAFCLC